MPICYNISIPSKELKICGKVFLINYNQIVGTKNCNRPLQGAQFLVPFLIGVLTTKNDISSNLDTFPVKAHTWAVFPNEGIFPFTLQDTMARIYSEWFMTADYELAEPFSFSFTKMDDKKPNYAYSEIWIPVTKKE